jgi:hypothetical protein
MGKRRSVYRALVGNLGERDHLEEPRIDRRIILRLIFRKWNRTVNWIDLAQHGNRWRVLADMVKNLYVS